MVAVDLPSGDDLGALLPASLEKAGHAIVLLLGDERAEIDGRVEAVPDLELARFVGDAFDDPVVDRFVREQPRARGAALALVIEDRARRARNRLVEIGVGEDDGGRLAAELQ